MQGGDLAVHKRAYPPDVVKYLMAEGTLMPLIYTLGHNV